MAPLHRRFGDYVQYETSEGGELRNGCWYPFASAPLPTLSADASQAMGVPARAASGSNTTATRASSPAPAIAAKAATAQASARVDESAVTSAQEAKQAADTSAAEATGVTEAKQVAEARARVDATIEAAKAVKLAETAATAKATAVILADEAAPPKLLERPAPHLPRVEAGSRHAEVELLGPESEMTVNADGLVRYNDYETLTSSDNDSHSDMFLFKQRQLSVRKIETPGLGPGAASAGCFVGAPALIVAARFGNAPSAQLRPSLPAHDGRAVPVAALLTGSHETGTPAVTSIVSHTAGDTMTGMHEPSSTSVSPTVTGYTFLCCLLLARYHGSSSIGVPTALTGYAILCFLVMAWMPTVAGVPFRLTDVTPTVITAPTLVGSLGTSTLTNMTGTGFSVDRLLVCDAPAQHAMVW